MDILSGFRISSTGNFAKMKVNVRSFQDVAKTNSYSPATQLEPTAQSLLQVHRLRESLAAIRPGKLMQSGTLISARFASAISSSALDFSSNSPTQLRSTEEINTAPTSFQHNGPTWNGSTETAPWSGLGSTANVTVGGNYDGSNGSGTLKFKVISAGTHGKDDLRIRESAEDGSTIQTINISKDDPLNKVYSLSNGLSITLDEGVLVKNDFFEVDTSVVSTSFAPSDPGWKGSTASPSIGGAYDGSNGSGDLTFRVVRGGVHGSTDLKLNVYAPDDSLIEAINVRKNDAINKVYSLSNGLEFTLGEGKLIVQESLSVSVQAGEPDNFTKTPEWNHGSSTATVTGTYDGSNGTGSLSVRALNNGVIGTDDLRVRVYDTDGSTLKTIDLDAKNPVDQSYDLSNGLSVTFSPGDMIKNETFSIDVASSATFSTSPNPVASTAEPAIRGIYDGSMGTDTLTFTVTQGGTHGIDDLKFEVHKSDGSFVETIDIGVDDAEGQQFSLANGLIFSLGDGKLVSNESFTLDVSHLVPTSVNPNLSFNGTGIDDPKLEDQFTVTDGTFNINGYSIDVFSTDSINSVLDRINDAGIGITAGFDVATETVVLTRIPAGNEQSGGNPVQNEPGMNQEIVLTDDTSGFLAATKLANAREVLGTGDERTILADLSFMTGVTSGVLDINGVSINFDVDLDSLEDVLARIDSVVPDVDVEFDDESNLVSLTADQMKELSLSSGDTGFFAAINVKEGLYNSVEAKQLGARATGFSYSVRRDTAQAINEFGRRFNSIFENRYGEQADSFISELRSELRSAASDIFDPNLRQQKAKLGLEFKLDAEDGNVFNYAAGDITHFVKNLKTNNGATEFNELFFGETSADQGIVDRMLSIVKSTESKLSLKLGSMGSFVDVWA